VHTSRTWGPLRKHGTRTHHEDPLQRFSWILHYEGALSRTPYGNAGQGTTAGIQNGDLPRSPIPRTHFEDALQNSTTETPASGPFQWSITRIHYEDFPRIPHTGDTLGGRGPGINCGDPKRDLMTNAHCSVPSRIPHVEQMSPTPMTNTMPGVPAPKIACNGPSRCSVAGIPCGNSLRGPIARIHYKDPLRRFFWDPEDHNRTPWAHNDYKDPLQRFFSDLEDHNDDKDPLRRFFSDLGDPQRRRGPQFREPNARIQGRGATTRLKFRERDRGRVTHTHTALQGTGTRNLPQNANRTTQHHGSRTITTNDTIIHNS
jgi:hypothetical protein